ncbi:carboxylesterase 1C-like [Branchiostoma lanceolatum]|uniref:carboxylesterase 1C-like n=1 Tax=Branchiostoma lanceolatum TaxID=7740 RepID=UPI003451C244
MPSEAHTVAAPSLLLLLLHLSSVVPATADNGEGVPVVSTAGGKVRGTVQYTNDLPNKPVYTFKGIPYAAPPVGDLRFRAPQPAAPWEGVRDASAVGPHCPQDPGFFAFWPTKLPHNDTDEDCLTLSVETPRLEKDAKLPVLLWIHGGGLSVGVGYFVPFTSLSAHQDVVVVTFNYRIGALGFFSTGDENAPGNFGFLDQVRDSGNGLGPGEQMIRNFGGDPDLVTIFGESAGGSSVCYQVASPLSKGLFQRAISQSGGCQSIDVNPKPLERAVTLAEDLGCDVKDTAAMVDCLRKKPADDFAPAVQRMIMTLAAQGHMFAFPPVVDGAFLPAHPHELFDANQANPVDYLLGANNHEYGYIFTSYMVPGYEQGMTEDTFVMMLRMLVGRLYPGGNQDSMVAALRQVYRDDENPDDPMAILKQFTFAYGDQWYMAPTVLVANKLAGVGQRVYLYENQYGPSHLTANRPDWVGCDHADDVYIVPGMAFIDVFFRDGGLIPFSTDDKKVTLDMMAFWGNFARTG